MSKVLIIDDDPELCKLAQAVLCTQSHDVTTTTDPEDGLKRLEQDHFDLLLLDIFMPKKDGFEILHDLRAGPGKRLKIIMMSAGGPRGLGDYLDSAPILGADATLKKPFTPDELINLVNGCS